MRAETGKGREVKIDGSRADGATARQRDLRLAGPREEGPQDQDGRSHLPDQVIVGGCGDEGGRCHFDRPVARPELGSEALQQRCQRLGVAQPGIAGQRDGLVRQQGCRHEGEGSVLGPLDLHLAAQRLTAPYADAVHAGQTRGSVTCRCPMYLPMRSA